MELRVKYDDNQLHMTTAEKVQFMLRFIAKVFLYSALTLFVLIALMFLLYYGDRLYNKKTGTNKHPLFAAYIIVTNSMVPTINVNDAIVIKRSLKLNINDIITFSSTDPAHLGMTVTHRIVGKQESDNGAYIFRTKGDNNNVEDPTWVKEDNVYGKVFLMIPKLGFVRNFLVTPLGFGLVIILPFSLIIIYDISKFSKILKKKKEEEEII